MYMYICLAKLINHHLTQHVLIHRRGKQFLKIDTFMFIFPGELKRFSDMSMCLYMLQGHLSSALNVLDVAKLFRTFLLGIISHC